MTTDKNILNKLYVFMALFVVFVVAVGFKLIDIQFAHGEEYQEMAQKRAYRNFTIPANRGNLYDSQGNLLATSVPEYDIRFDAVTVSEKDFNENVTSLAKNLSKLLGRPESYYKNRLISARKTGNRYLFIARDLRYSDYLKIKSFPLFKLGPYRGGFIAEQKIHRERPLGKIGERTVGRGQAGLEGAFNEYLKGKDGHRLKQKIAKGLWKPINDANEVDPKDGLDVISTIDVNIQDIVHHALLRQLEKFKADHGTAIVMDVKTGAIRGMANLGRTKEGTYYEKRNYAVWEAQEPGSTFKLISLVAALEDKVVDTAQVFDSENGVVKYYDRYVRDSHWGGYGKITAARALEVSSNTVFSKIITQGYKDNADAFIDRLEYMGIGSKLGLEINGEGQPVLPRPGDRNWYGTTLPWLSFGYGVSITPLQTLAFYNAIANGGIEVKPRLIKEIKDRDRVIKDFTAEEHRKSICSAETANIAKTLLADVVKKGTGMGIRMKDLPLAGKTGTAVSSYGTGKKTYTGSFAGFFPADNPRYSCIVVINNPDTRLGFYGAQVAAPAFQEIAKKIHIRTPRLDSLKTFVIQKDEEQKAYNHYFEITKSDENQTPDVQGLPVMDALPLLENRGLKVKLEGSGIVYAQSLAPGSLIKRHQTINLKAH